MLAARLSWVGPSFLSTIRQETPCRFSSAAMNRPAGPAPTTNTWVSVAIRYSLVGISVTQGALDDSRTSDAGRCRDRVYRQGHSQEHRALPRRARLQRQF